MTVGWAVLHTVDLLRGKQHRIAYLRILAHLLGQIEGCYVFGIRHFALHPPRLTQQHQP